MRILCVFGQHNYGNPERGEGYEYVNFLQTFQRLGHEVHFFESWNRNCYKDFQELNRALLLEVERRRPDIILSVLFGYEIWLETWEILKNYGAAATVNWTTDDSWRYSQFSRFVAPQFHAFTTTYPSIYAKYLEDGIHHVLLTQWASNSTNFQSPIPASRCRYPVTFVGTAHGNRRKWVERLQKRGIDVLCYGYGWPNGPVAADEIPRIIRNSIISLNFSNGAKMILDGMRTNTTNQIKARTFEVPGAGGFLLTEEADGLDRYYVPNKEIAIFHNLEELVGKIRHYLSNPSKRDEVAIAGYERTRSEHTYEQRLDELIDFAIAQRESHLRSLGASPSGKIDWARFEEAAKRHKAGIGHRILKRTYGCTVLGGLGSDTRPTGCASNDLRIELAVGGFTYVFGSRMARKTFLQGKLTMDGPLVSIGLQFYNNETTLPVAINSLLNQSYRNFELILHDDGSTDGSLSIARRYNDPRILLYSDHVNKKRPTRMNESLDLAKGKYYALMDGDDVSYPDRLSKQVKYLESNPSVDLLGRWHVGVQRGWKPARKATAASEPRRYLRDTLGRFSVGSADVYGTN